MGIIDDLKKGRIDQADCKLRALEAAACFKAFLPDSPGAEWLCGLNRFSEVRPWKYWDVELITLSLQILERDLNRSAEAIQAWNSQLSVAFINLFLPTELHEFEESFNTNGAKDLFAIHTLVHPEYLRLAEHVFGNLICVFWGIIKKKGVKAKIDLEGAKNLFLEKGYKALYSGFDDRIRNGIAHGDVHYRADGIVYGQSGIQHEYKKHASHPTFPLL